MSEAEQRLDQVFIQAFGTTHPAMLDWVSIKFQLKELGSIKDSLAGIAPESVPLMREALTELLFAVENADETGYVQDVGFIDLDALHEKCHAALAAATPTKGEKE